MQTMTATSAQARAMSRMPMIARVFVPTSTTAATMAQEVAKIMESTMDIEWGRYSIILAYPMLQQARDVTPFAPTDQDGTRSLAMVVPQVGYERVWYQDTDLDESTWTHIPFEGFFEDAIRLHREFADHRVITVRFTF